MVSLTSPQLRPSSLPFDEQPVDSMLVGVVACLLLLGAVMVFSAGVSAGTTFELQTTHIIKHSIHIGVGLGVMVLVRHFPLDLLQRLAPLLFGVGLLMLLVLFIPGVGKEVNGSVRWFDVGFRVQPAELMKLIMAIYVADYFTRKENQIQVFKVGVLNIGLVLALVAGLLLMQPDFGTVVVIAVMLATLMYIAGVPNNYFIAAIFVAAVLLALIVWLEPYRVARLMTYQNPWEDPFNKGFQLTQALMAVGRGSWFGVGLGNSLQKLNYLPHADNDFLIAIVAEELGAVGVVSVMILFCLILWRAFVIGSRALLTGRRFSGLLAFGVGVLLAINSGIHIGVNTGLLPTKGLTLPLMSSGGSSMVVSLLAVGLLLAVDRESRARPYSRSKGRVTG